MPMLTNNLFLNKYPAGVCLENNMHKQDPITGIIAFNPGNGVDLSKLNAE
ncbi:hypothetical protein VEE76_28060 [Escherichia coli]|nr:hypothetical protein VEE33_39840 [Escherichia coli]BEC37725.1 hypothetical protein VEE76_28060 [Escherichia coli]BEG24776.1 hypothetical protein VEF10_13390 [Escherichia coli]